MASKSMPPAGVIVKLKPPARTRKPALPAEERQVIELLPKALQGVAREIMIDTEMNELGKLFMERSGEFSSPAAALLAGIALHGPARAHFDAHLDRVWSGATSLPRTLQQEVIVGGGLHAAIYASVRVSRGFPPPLVLEQEARVGGAFAVSVEPSFFLNSRNRPGPLSVPGDARGALNVLPGSMFQPSDMGGSEYQTNTSLAWTIRLALAMNANVYGGRLVKSLTRNRDNTVEITLDGDDRITARRVIVATGLNSPNRVVPYRGDRVMTFGKFMERMDAPFPLRGMKRVAVIGSGDGGKTAIDALTGQGPSQRFSVASLDYPDRIDWYGVPDDQRTRRSFESCNRSRYRGIGRLLPVELDGPSRVTPMSATTAFAQGYECVYVREMPYDYVIDCAGYLSGTPVGAPTFEQFSLGGRTVGRRVPDSEIYLIGPASTVPVSDTEEVFLRGIPEGDSSLFRYAGRTASLAGYLK